MSGVRFLLAGKSWVSSITHFKGWDFFSGTVYETGTEYLDKVLVPPAFEFHHMPSHIAAKEFPVDRDGLNSRSSCTSWLQFVRVSIKLADGVSFTQQDGVGEKGAFRCSRRRR